MWRRTRRRGAEAASPQLREPPGRLRAHARRTAAQPRRWQRESIAKQILEICGYTRKWEASKTRCLAKVDLLNEVAARCRREGAHFHFARNSASGFRIWQTCPEFLRRSVSWPGRPKGAIDRLVSAREREGTNNGPYQSKGTPCRNASGNESTVVYNILYYNTSQYNTFPM